MFSKAVGDLASGRYPHYQYPYALQPGQIRLLQLIRSSDHYGVFNFKFLLIDLPPRSSNRECETRYIALSYVWGDENNKKRIRVDGRDMYITRNLYSALRDLTPELHTFPIWVDAACIQQKPECNAEKKTQLDRMGDVYRYAVKVFVHLGQYRNDSAARYIQQIGGETFDLGAMIFTDIDLAFWPDFEGREHQQAKVTIRQNLERKMDAIQGGIISRPSIPTREIFDLFDQPWFTRAWVIQELALARGDPASVIFALGPTQRVSWEHLWGAYFFLARWIMREAHRIESAVGMPARLFALAMYRKRVGINQRFFDPRAALTIGIRKLYIQQQLSLSLKSLLIRLHVGESYHALGCREEVDKVNAIASMANDAGVVSDIRRRHNDWQGYYTDLARYLIEQGHVDLLGLCRHRHPSLPSWVVDWSRQQWPPWLGFKNVDQNDNEQLFNAAGNTAARCYLTSSPRALNLAGFFVDTIMDVSCSWPEPDCDDVGDPKFYEDLGDGSGLRLNENRINGLKPANFDPARAQIRFAQLSEAFKVSRAYTPEQKEDGIWRVVLADKETNSIGQITRATERSRQGIFAVLASIKSPTPSQTFDAIGSTTCVNMMLSFYGSRIFTTKKEFIGMCHFNTAAEDKIFIPSGGHCPYAIRRQRSSESADAWQLLGEVYIYGIMDGELRLQDKVPEIISLI
ncbi:hypothetical protein S40288_07133 [Stachybotrys chartarum IBT 40288]|nr:hypothetical protein S40288_07133 [Stachybotrys chartarum IBT 40288]